MKNLIIYTCLFLFSMYSFGESIPGSKGARISGTVKDKSNSKNLEYSNIALFNQIDSSIVTGTITDQNGTFILENIPSGKYYLEADFIGYKKETIENIEIKGKKDDVSINIGLIVAAEMLKEMEVVADRNYIDYKIDKKVVNVSQHINAQGGSAADVLENVPSVAVDMDGNVSLRGSTSYTVLIDGKPSVLEGSDALKQIPAEMIENIEIITNPSAKYDPDGTTGIINIILKKNKQDGVNGMVSGTYATMNKFGGNANINLRKGKVNYFISADYNKNPNKASAFEDRTNYSGDTTLFLEERSDREHTFRPWKLTGGADYILNDRNSVTISANVGSYGFFRDFETRYHAYTEPYTNDSYILSNNSFSVDGLYYSANATYIHKFRNEGEKIEATISAWQWTGEQTESSNQTSTDANWNSLGSYDKSRTRHLSLRDNLKIKADYTKPIGKHKLETGIQAHINPGTNEFIFEDYDPDSDQWLENNEFSNYMEFKRNLYSAYAIVSGQVIGFGYQLGIRGEYTDRLLHQVTSEEKYPVELLNYYPSVHLSRAINQSQQLQLSYSRRINRPRPWELNPFPNYSDNYNFSKGNPYLLPEDIDAVEFNYYNRMKKGFVSAGLFYRLTHNTKVMNINIDEQNRLYLLFENLDNTNSSGTELMVNLDPVKWFNLNVSTSIYQYNMKGNITGRVVDKSSLVADSRASFTVKIKNTNRVQINGFYSSPQEEAVGSREAMYGFGIAIKQDLFERKATLSLSARNLFGTRKYRVKSATDTYASYIGHDGEANVVRLTFTYRINNYKQVNREEMEMNFGAQ